MVVTYQDVVAANGALAAWAFTEAAGLAFAPYIGGSGLVGTGTFAYQQAGPFAASFGLQINTLSKTDLTFVATVQPPITTELWVKLASATPATRQHLYYVGNPGANGTGVDVATTGEIRFLQGGRADNALGIFWPDTLWHLVQLASAADGVTITLAIDGIVRVRRTVTISNAPAPNHLYFSGDSAAGNVVGETIAMGAFYPYELTPTQLRSSFIAASTPGAALATTLAGAGTVLADAATILDEILAAVRKTF
jgi:hypothetical protein